MIPRLKVTFKRFCNVDYVVLVWAHNGYAPALSIAAKVALDDAKRERIEAAVQALLVELG